MVREKRKERENGGKVEGKKGAVLQAQNVN